MPTIILTEKNQETVAVFMRDRIDSYLKSKDDKLITVESIQKLLIARGTILK